MLLQTLVLIIFSCCMYSFLQTAKNSSDSELIIKWTHVYAHTHLSKCYFFPSSPELSINSTIGVLKHLGLFII